MRSGCLTSALECSVDESALEPVKKLGADFLITKLPCLGFYLQELIEGLEEQA